MTPAKRPIKAANLRWQDVPIARSVDVVEGFFGLQEVSGVEVSWEQGHAVFYAKEEAETEAENSKNEKKGVNRSLLTEEEEKSMEKGRERGGDSIRSSESSDFEGFSDHEDGANAASAAEGEKSTGISAEKFDGSHGEKSEGNSNGSLDETSAESSAKSAAASAAAAVSAASAEPLDEISTAKWTSLGLHNPTAAAVASLGLKTPTAVQEQCIPLALKGLDLIGKAETGSGKTIAYGLPLLELLVKSAGAKNAGVVGVVLAPTRELAKQVHRSLVEIAQQMPHAEVSRAPDAEVSKKTVSPADISKQIVAITGGFSIQKQQRLLSKSPGLVVATPGRFLEIIQLDNDILDKFSDVKCLVLDEADRLLQDGHFAELETALTVLKNHRKAAKWQTLVFSATFSKVLFSKLDKNDRRSTKPQKELADDSEIIDFLKQKLGFSKNLKIVDLNPNEGVSASISELLIECDDLTRDLFLYYFLLAKQGSTLVFANSIDAVKRLASFLKHLNINTFSLHSSMLQKQRLTNLEKFSASLNEQAVLIATDVAARGLDIPQIDHVIHYHLPRSADMYIHRSGRAGRAGRTGISVMLCSPKDAAGPLKRLKTVLRQDDVKMMPIDVSFLDQLRGRVKIAHKLAEAAVSKSSLSKSDSWEKKVADALEIDATLFEDSSLVKQKAKKQEKMVSVAEQRRLAAELDALLKKKLRGTISLKPEVLGLKRIEEEQQKGVKRKQELDMMKRKKVEERKSRKSKRRDEKEGRKVLAEEVGEDEKEEKRSKKKRKTKRG